MRTMQQWFDEYGESHQNAFNKTMHWICIPVIFFSIYGFLASIPSDFLKPMVAPEFGFYANYGTLFFVAGLTFYLRISFSMFLGMVAVCLFTMVGNKWVASLPFPLWQSSLVLFVAGWIGQFYGHKVEGKKPSFFKDLQFLMIGPAWLIGFVYKKMGIRY